MRVAVVGSGISGLSAAYALNKRGVDVELYEKEPIPGGHAKSLLVKSKLLGHPPAAVDVAFVLINRYAYPNFIRFLDELGVGVQAAHSSMTVSDKYSGISWSSSSFSGFFSTPGSLFDYRMWRLLYDMLRFYSCAQQILRDPFPSSFDITIGDYLAMNGYSSVFSNDYLLPLASMLWIIPPDMCATELPIKTLVQYMYNHRLLQLYGKSDWLTVMGGSGAYVAKALQKLGENRVHLGTEVLKAVSLTSGRVELSFKDKKPETFDHVVMACHSDTTHRILREGNITAEENRIFEKFQWSASTVVMHTDEKLMPSNKFVWSAWNTCFEKYSPTRFGMSMCSWMNKIQDISRDEYGDIFGTVNPTQQPDADSVLGQYTFEHVVFNKKCIEAQREMPSIQKKRGIVYAGTYLDRGFHEDGFVSGINAAKLLVGDDGSPLFCLQPFDAKLNFSWNWIFFSFFEMTGLRLCASYVFWMLLQFFQFCFETRTSPKPFKY